MNLHEEQLSGESCNRKFFQAICLLRSLLHVIFLVNIFKGHATLGNYGTDLMVITKGELKQNTRKQRKDKTGGD